MQILGLQILLLFSQIVRYTTASPFPQITDPTAQTSNITISRTASTSTNKLYDDCKIAIDQFPHDPPTQPIPAQFSRNPDRGVYTLPQERVHGICSAEVVFLNDVSRETSSWQDIRVIMFEMNERLLQIGGVVIYEPTGLHRGIELWLLDYTSKELAGVAEGAGPAPGATHGESNGVIANLLNGEPPIDGGDDVEADA